jgi:hypothetical protein
VVQQGSQVIDEGGNDFAMVADERLAMHLSDGIDVRRLFVPDEHWAAPYRRDFLLPPWASNGGASG